MTTKTRLSGCGVSRRDMMRIGAGGLGFGLFGGIGPVPYVFSQASQVGRARRRRARSWWSSSGSAATTG